MKSIWIINEYAGSPYHGMVFRHYYLSKELLKLGYNVTIISASYSHLFRSLTVVKKRFTFEIIDGINYLWIKVPKYKNSNDKKRVLKWFIFSIYLFFISIKKLKKPDYILLSCPGILITIPSLYLSKKFNSHLIFEVRDIWPLSLIELGGYSKNNIFIKLLSFCENLAIRKNDLIISVLPNYGEYLKEKGFDKKFIYIPNGIDLEEMQKIELLSEDIKNQIPKDKFIVAYTGTIGKANSLDYFIEAAKILKDYEDILFLIVGEGGEKERLKKIAEGFDNIKFLPSISKTMVQNLLFHVDICYIGWKKLKLYKFGISPNKIFDYMYSGKTIIQSIDTKNDPISLANCGINVEPENPVAIADAVLKFYNMKPEERKKIGDNGRRYVLENHTYDKLAFKLYKILK